jgi:membrane protein implicated in regulation of membrane protease activity
VGGVAWVVWAVVAAALGIGELLTPGLFFLGPVALAAVAAAITAALGAGSVAAAIVFLVCAVLSLAVLRPLARAHLHVPAISRTGTAALVGRRGVVTRKVDGHGGRVRIGGEEWTARAYVDGEEIAEGTSVDVVEIQGATALVMR